MRIKFEDVAALEAKANNLAGKIQGKKEHTEQLAQSYIDAILKACARLKDMVKADTAAGR